MSEPDLEALDRRLRTVERRLDGDPDSSLGVDDAGDPTQHADRLENLERTVTDLEAAVQAIRGYVGTVRAEDRVSSGETARNRSADAAGGVEAVDAGWNSDAGTAPSGPTESSRRRREAARASDGGRRAAGVPRDESGGCGVGTAHCGSPEHPSPSGRPDDWGLDDGHERESCPSPGLLARIRDVL